MPGSEVSGDKARFSGPNVKLGEETVTDEGVGGDRGVKGLTGDSRSGVF